MKPVVTAPEFDHLSQLPKAPEPIPCVERHFYSLPSTCEMVLPVLAALQDYHKWLAERKISVEMVIHNPTPELDFLLTALPQAKILDILRDTKGLTLDLFDVSVYFDSELAYQMSLVTKKHAAQVFGIMIGSDPPNVLPNVSIVTEGIEPEYDVLIMPFFGSERVYEFFQNSRPDLNCQQLLSDPRVTEWNWTWALRGRMLISISSGLTYLAAAAGRAVVEIYPSDRHRDWLSKWSNRMYQMIYGEQEQITPELVFRAAGVVWKRVEQRERALAGLPQSVPSESTNGAESATK